MQNEHDSYASYQYDHEDESDQEETELYFQIKLAKYPRALELILTFENFKTEFRDFVSKYCLSRDESLALKEIVKARIAEQIQKQNQKQVKKVPKKSAAKLFSTQVDTSHQFHSCNSPISSIHSHSSAQSLISMVHKDDMIGRQSDNRNQNNQEQAKNSHNYNQSVLQRQQQHVSFNDFYEKKDEENQNDELEDVQAIPKGVGQRKNDKQVVGKVSHPNTEQYDNYFTLNHQKQSPHNPTRTPVVKQIEMFTPVKNKFPLNNISKGDSSPVIDNKKAKAKHIPQSTKIQSTHYNKDSSIDKSNPKKQQAKSTQSKGLKSTGKQQKQVIREIFYRLHREETASWVQRQKPEPKSPKLKQDERVVYESVMSHRQKFIGMNQEEKQEIFTKLHFTSTESSMNRKTQLKGSNNYSNQIEHVINETNKRHQMDDKRSSHFQKKQIDLSRSLYGCRLKRCNAHCQQYEEEKRRIQEAKKRLDRQEEIKRKFRSRSKESMTARSGGKSQQKKKLFGQCQCCHKQRIAESVKKKEEQRGRNYKRSYKTSTKYSLQKRFLPTNISFISDVLEQSYNELFPN